MLSQTEQHGHQWISLFSAFSLENMVHASHGVLPEKCGWTPIEESDEREKTISSFHAHQPLHHCIAGHQIEISNPIY